MPDLSPTEPGRDNGHGPAGTPGPKADAPAPSTGGEGMDPVPEAMRRLFTGVAHRTSRLSGPTEDEELLNRPGQLLQPNARDPKLGAFTHTEPWRVLRIQAEFVYGLNALAEVGAAVAVFGSARIKPEHRWYVASRDFAHKMAKSGFAIITGGGPGLMQAANQGAHEAGGLSIGCNIELPFEQSANPYADLSVNFRYFFVRKMMFVKFADGFVIFPGGFGTLDELFEALTLVQTRKIHRFPIVLYDKAYWNPLLEWVRNTQLAEGMISSEDLNLLMVVDSIDEAHDIILDCYRERCWASWEKSEGAKLDSDPPGAPRTAPDPRKSDAE